MKKILFLAAPILLITGCATSQPEVFKLQTGELVTCQRYAQRDCGMNIMQCGEDSTLEFDCLQDVHYVGKVGVTPAPEKKEHQAESEGEVK